MEETKAEDKHYKFQYKGITLDPYRIFRIYGITDPEQQHSIKKLLRAGKSIKPLKQDILEVIMTLNRWVEIIEEDAEAEPVDPDIYFTTLGERLERGKAIGNEAEVINKFREELGLPPTGYILLSKR